MKSEDGKAEVSWSSQLICIMVFELGETETLACVGGALFLVTAVPSSTDPLQAPTEA